MFDDYKSEPLALPRGLDQGFPLSSIAFQFYNTDLVDVCNPDNGEEVIAFMNGISLSETNPKVKCRWAVPMVD